MPIKEILKRPSKRSNYLNVHWSLESNYGGSKRKTPIGHEEPSRQIKSTTNKLVINYDNMFAEEVYPKSHTNLPNIYNGNGSAYGLQWLNDKDDCISLCSEESFGIPHSQRMRGGNQRPQQEVDTLILSPNQCKIKPPGMAYFQNKTKINVISVEMLRNATTRNTYRQRSMKFRTKKCPEKQPPTRTRGTQSLYRESSAQTLPYLPPVSNDPEELENMELFKLPTILMGNGPPGSYEVEVLERARKRWAFANALKENFRKQLAQARQQAKLPQHEHILEAFEWEHWIEREEYIQECQMLRLEILIRMFDKRERQMRNASHARIQQSCAQIEAKRREALRKNEIEFGRAMRRLEMEHSKKPRTWRKEHISQGLGDPTSEFYAPKMRYGIDPGRRHFTASRKGFDMRMDDLERKTVNMDPVHLKCPFAKLRAWSKPKEVVQEVEQNFCSEVNLRKLYESLRTLRETSNKPKTTPLCLKTRKLTTVIPEESSSPRTTRVTAYEYPKKDCSSEDSGLQRLREERDHQEYLHEVRQEKHTERQLREHLQRELHQEELETLIQAYEGNTIGWLMRFLSEEMSRLKEQRKLHFFAMLAKRERWHREAAEAGLRQKENCMRETYEKLYQECEETNKEMAESYLHSIVGEDIEDYAEQQAEEHVVAVAKDLDKEISGWLTSFREVQNPLNYDKLRHALRDIVTPDVDKILYRLERDDCIDYILNGVLMPKVYHRLEPYDISFSVATDFVDRLIDNDLHLNSSDCSSDCNCSEFDTCSSARQEAKTILRKLIRHAVPGRRWRTSTERVADENVKDILDDIFDRIVPKGSIMGMNKPMLDAAQKFSCIDLTLPERELYFSDLSEEADSPESQGYCKMSRLGEMPPKTLVDVTKTLDRTEKLLLADTDQISADKFIINVQGYESPKAREKPTIVHNIPSTHDISSVWDFSQTPCYCRTSSDEIAVEEECYEETEMGETSPEIEGEELELIHEICSAEMPSSPRNFEEEVEDEREPDEDESPVKADEKKIDSQVRFDDKPKVEEIVESEPLPQSKEEDDDDDVSGVIPVSFSYDPTVKYTVPVPSNFEIRDSEIPVDSTEQKDDTEK